MDRSRSVPGELSKVVTHYGVDIALVQEPYAAPGKVLGFGSKVKTVHFRCAQTQPWAAVILYNKKWAVLDIQSLSSPTCAIAQVMGDGMKVYMVSLYCPPSGDINNSIRELECILGKLRGENIIISMDGNAKATLWGSETTDDRGTLLLETILKWDLVCVNDPEAGPTFISSRGSSYIDLTLTTKDVVIDNWYMVHDTTSEHGLIIYEYNVGKVLDPQWCSLGSFGFLSVNWHKFRQKLGQNLLSKNFEIIEDKYEVIRYCTHIQCSIKDAMVCAIPKVMRKHRAPRWWCNELNSLKRQVNKSRRAFQRCSDNETRNNLKEVYINKRKAYKVRLKAIREESWKRYVCAKTKGDPWGTPYKVLMNKLKTNQVLVNMKSGNR
ncbi:uncharacterized protein LOC111615788 [Centruroides sculpturatus]|uniref:uncharacterized protein LOC111615788 n=1 Tax=Centruroides sculpturatus TaxID=218467 RepID=UPI000C6D1D4A|nr:uncharacterized protein LOC111615788 [Centruroides sculpturatus]